MSFTDAFLIETKQIASEISRDRIEAMAQILSEIKGRLFILGVGGSAANASHAVNDFRKICGIEAYTPTDNVAELTARTNDDGWETVFKAWLEGSHLKVEDVVLVLSVGGGTRMVSRNIVKAVSYARSVGSKVLGIVGRSDGYTAEVADVCIVVPTITLDRVTPHTEAWQSVILHLIVSHPVWRAHDS
jgi:D-sedoheptulose 7-phosphate isomerase